MNYIIFIVSYDFARPCLQLYDIVHETMHTLGMAHESARSDIGTVINAAMEEDECGTGGHKGYAQSMFQVAFQSMMNYNNWFVACS